MRQLGYESNEADPDLWMKVCTQKTENSPNMYYSYILIYVDEILCIHDDLNLILTQIDKYFPLKPISLGALEIYLGAELMLMQLQNGVWAWGLSLSKTIQEAVCNCKKYVEENLPKFYKLTRLAPNPFLQIINQSWICHLNYHQSMHHTTNPLWEYIGGW